MKLNLRLWVIVLASLAAFNLGFAADTPATAKPYPLKTCVVSGESLDSMGKPYIFQHEGQEIKLCCKSCLKKFQADPAKYLQKLKNG